MASSSSSSVDDRGFFFVLPQLGLPDPGGEKVEVKAAIGIKEEVLLPLFQSNINDLPLRAYDDNATLTGLDYRGSAWLFPLVQPPSLPSPPQFFKVLAKRVLPQTLPTQRNKLIAEAEWVRIPIKVYTRQMRAERSNFKPSEESASELERYHLLEWGKFAELTPDLTPLDEREEVVEGEMTEWDVLMDKSTLTKEWTQETYFRKMREAAQRGESIDITTLKIRTRIHPAEDNDFRSIDYIVVTQEETIKYMAAGKGFPEERWEHLPLEAMKPGAYRVSVNIHRLDAGMKAFSREEWPPAPLS